jgi:NADPH-dependent 2,4-dienoyl-CoA reductase/sulfur reductase-like enzyme
MEPFDYLIIGGGIAGTTAAQVIREKDSVHTIAIVTDEPYRLYSRILLSKPNFLLGKITPDQVFLKTDAWYKERAITRVFGKRAVALHAKEKEITLEGGETLGYKKLLLATGGRVKKIDAEGSERVQYVRTLPDAEAILAKFKTAKDAVVLGGGFISFEMCDIFAKAGVKTSVYLRKNYFWESLWDLASGKLIEEALRKAGITIFPNAEFKKIPPADIVVGGFGMQYDVQWLSSAGVRTRNGVLTDEYLETNLPDIYAAGDIAEYKDLILNEEIQLGNWVGAMMQGRTAGMNMARPAGEHTPYRLVSSYTTVGLGLTIAFVGDVRPLPDREVRVIGSPKENSYGRILMKGEKVVGATLINRMQELGEITRMIKGE